MLLLYQLGGQIGLDAHDPLARHGSLSSRHEMLSGHDCLVKISSLLTCVLHTTEKKKKEREEYLVLENKME